MALIQARKLTTTEKLTEREIKIGKYASGVATQAFYTQRMHIAPAPLPQPILMPVYGFFSECERNSENFWRITEKNIDCKMSGTATKVASMPFHQWIAEKENVSFKQALQLYFHVVYDCLRHIVVIHNSQYTNV